MYSQHIIRRENRQRDMCLYLNTLINLFVNEKADLWKKAVRSGADQGNNQDKKDKGKKDKGRDRKTKGNDRCVSQASVCKTTLSSLKMREYVAP
jgi:hypothetical protein